ncbi:PAS domain-containing protein [Sphingomonas swuensis]|uniref:histidine kinase n=1 Tax=Sphingomonas swuensis TaxID=977800 RepID=A0ABP7T598_9SPHN
MLTSFDWSDFPLGSPDHWPSALKVALSLCVDSSFPTAIYCTRELRLFYNDAWAPIAGERHPWAFGRPGAEVWSDIWSVVGPQFDEVWRTGDGFAAFDQMLPMRRGGEVQETYWNYSFTPIRDENGEIVGILNQGNETTARVVGERTQSFRLDLEQALRNLDDPISVMRVAAERLGAALDVGRAGYGEIDADGEIIRVSRDWTRSTPSLAGEARLLDGFGEAIAEELRAGRTLVVDDSTSDMRVAGAGVADAWASIDLRAIIAVPLIKEGRLVAFLYAHESKLRHWKATEIALMQDAAERTWAAVERARAEQALHELNETLEAQVEARSAERDRLWNLSQDMLARADFTGMMSAVSPAWTQVLGWTEAELLTRGYATFMHPDDMPPTLAAIEQMSATREPARFQNRIATADGGWKPIEWTVAPEADGQNFIAVGRDLSDAKKQESELAAAQEALRQSQKMEAMGSLTGGVAHDFNNLLTPIIGSLDMLVRKGIGSERERRLIDGALQSAERAKTLVQRLLAFARRQPLQMTAVDIDTLVGGMTDLIASTVGPTIDLSVDVDPALPPAIADANQLEMALLNLAVNARDAMPKGGRLTIAARSEVISAGHPFGLARGDYVRLSVGDTGAGMDKATLRRAVEPFFSTKGIGKGTGLGLSMVHGLAAQLGGGLTIDSTPNEGTDVTLWLPLSAEPAKGQAPSSRPAQTPLVRGTVLLVDDEDLVRMSTADMLIDLGFDVVETTSGNEALTLLDTGQVPDLLVTDHLMPGLSGADLASLARARIPGLPVLIVSGYAEVDGISPDLPRLTKPFRNADLAAHLAKILPVSGR